jgi:hypothetical protein
MKKNYYVLAMLTLLTCISFAQVPSYVPTNGLSSWWSFTGNANDLSGNNNNGSVNGATLTTDRFGNPNSAYSYNGVNDYIDMGNMSSLNITGSISISCWVAPTQAPVPPAIYNSFTIIDKGITNTPTGYVLDLEPDSGVRVVGNPLQFSNAHLPMNGWTNVVYVLNGQNDSAFFYINGILDKTYSGIGALTQDTTHFWVGASSPSGGFASSYFYIGKIDDIGIWNRALTPTEITQIYSASGCTHIDTVTVYDTISTHVTVYDTTHVTIHDTTYTAIAVTDTLYINASLTGIAPPNNINEIRVYPNPAKTDLYIDCGNYASMSGYTIKVTNSIGQVVFSTTITQQQYDINLSSWSGHGIYVLSIYDQSNTVITTKEIVIQ